jgi:hypothetical protein
MQRVLAGLPVPGYTKFILPELRRSVLRRALLPRWL